MTLLLFSTAGYRGSQRFWNENLKKQKFSPYCCSTDAKMCVHEWSRSPFEHYYIILNPGQTL